MTIRNRLKLIGLVPILLLVLLSSYFFVISYLNFEKANTLKTVLKNNATLSNSLSEIGKERGLSSLYMGDNHKELLNTLTKQRKITDASLKTLKSNLIVENTSYIPILPELLGANIELDKNKYQTLFTNLGTLPAIRKAVDISDDNFQKVFFDGYTKKITNCMLDNLFQVQNFALDAEISTLIAALSQLYTVKENSGLERGFISYHIAKKSPMTFAEISLWDKFKVKANIFDLKQVTDINMMQDMQQVLSNPKAQKMLTELSKTTSAIQSNIYNGDYKVETMDWFALQTQKISLYAKAELIVSSALWSKSDAFLQKQFLLLSAATFIWLLSFILAFLGYATSRDITRNIKELEDVLNKAVDEMKNSNQYLSEDTEHIENIDLDTHAGTREAYKFLETLVDTAKEDKHVALQANEAKSLFLANMSHEIRTPLNGIVGFTEILRSTDLNSEQEEFLSIIDKSSENLLSIINNILDLSKIESNKIEIENIVFDAAEEFESAIETYAVGAADKNIDLNFYMDPAISNKLKGDPTKIKEVVINLLSNAIKFTSYGGAINFNIHKIESDDTEYSRIKFSVKDNGIGMTKEQQTRIFDAFSQADASVTRKYGGTGLGLTISGQFVELMGGHLELESVKDNGTTFYFDIPIEEIASSETNYAQAFTNLSIAKYQQEIPTTLDNYMESYFEYFGLTVKHFESVDDLREIKNQDIYKNYWIDLDKAKENILATISNIDKTKLIILANVTSRSKIEEMGIPQDNVIFKPITLTKLKNALTRALKGEPKPVKKALPIRITKFDANILVTEDNIINQKLIKRILEEQGMTIDLANNGLESFEKRRNNKYDLLFMDIQMPVMDGIEATHEILNYEQDEQLEHVPIVALTANALKGDRERFLNEGMDEYITKPIETSELLYVLNKFLSDKIYTVSPENTTKTVTSTPKVNTVKEKSSTPASLGKKILIAKKLLLEKMLLTKVIKNLGYSYETLENFDLLELKLASGSFDILIADENLITKDISQSNDNLAIITSEASKEEIEKFIKKQRG